jgi:HAD superfamily hydrolase (TIGR01459 family)
MADPVLPPQLEGIRSLADSRRAIFCDIWGVVHDGVRPYNAAVDALRRFRHGGGAVILLSNAPRLSADVPAQLAHIGVPSDSYDGIVTSGDATCALLNQRHAGKRYVRLGPQRDGAFFSALDLKEVQLTDADLIVCSGLADDENETPDDYREFLIQALARDLLFVCANPDIVVDKGEKKLFCAGALAVRYEAMGGKTLYAGKPHRPIYELAFERLAAVLPSPCTPAAVIAIGDGLKTDILGAEAAGIEAILITGGIHAEELHAAHRDESELLEKFLEAGGIEPHAVMRLLRW